MKLVICKGLNHCTAACASMEGSMDNKAKKGAINSCETSIERRRKEDRWSRFINGIPLEINFPTNMQRT